MTSLLLLGCMTGSLLLRKEKIDHPSCSDVLKPNRIHISQSKLKDFLLFLWGFLEGARGGKGFFSVLYKNKVYSCFLFYCDCKRSKCCWTPAVDALGMEARGEFDGDLGMSYSKHTAQQPFLSTPRQAASHGSLNTLQCTSLQMIFPRFV